MKKKIKNKIIYVFIPLLLIMSLIVYLIIASSNTGKSYNNVTSEALKQDNNKVTMVFSISCPHCYRMDKALINWLSNKKHIKLELIPATGSGWTEEARLFYTIKEVAGIRYKSIFKDIFDSYHNPQSNIKGFNEKIEYIAKKINSNPKKVLEVYKNSKKVESEIEKSRKIMSDYSITSVPQIIVNGKYKLNQKYFSSYQEIFNEIEKILKNN